MQIRFDHSEPVAKNIVRFYFKSERPVRYEAGQFIELIIPHENADSHGQKHWFTLVSSPTEELLSIATKFPDGQISTFKQALRQLKPGDEVKMVEPMGDFVLPKDKSIPLVFIAGGIGITPMRSMVKWLLDKNEKRQIKLIYAAHAPDEIAFRDTFEAYNLSTTLIITTPPPSWQGETGLINADRVLQLAPNHGQELYYISGPEPLVESLVKDLGTAGVDKRCLIGDYFPNYSKQL